MVVFTLEYSVPGDTTMNSPTTNPLRFLPVALLAPLVLMPEWAVGVTFPWLRLGVVLVAVVVAWAPWTTVVPAGPGK